MLKLKSKHKKFLKNILPFIMVMMIYSALIIPAQGFMGAYLASKNIDTAFIGTILSTSNILGFIGTYVLSFFCDKNKNIKWVFITSLVIIFVLIVIVLPLVSGKLLYITAVGALGFFQVPMVCLLDTWVLTSNYYIRQYFGLIKSGASFGYAVFALCYGNLVERFGWKCMFISSAIFIILTVAISIFIKDNYKEMFDFKDDEKDEKKNKNILHLLRNKNIIIITIITFLIFLPSNTINSFLFYIIKNLGGGAREQGIAFFVQSISEIPLLMLFPLLIKKFKTKHLMLFASINYLLRMILTYHASNVTSIILIYLIQSVTYAIYMPNMRHFVDKHSPRELKATAQSLVDSAGIGLSGVVATLFGGFIIQNFSLKTMLFLCIILSSLAVLFLIYVVIFVKDEDRKIQQV